MRARQKATPVKTHAVIAAKMLAMNILNRTRGPRVSRKQSFITRGLRRRVSKRLRYYAMRRFHTQLPLTVRLSAASRRFLPARFDLQKRMGKLVKKFVKTVRQKAVLQRPSNLRRPAKPWARAYLADRVYATSSRSLAHTSSVRTLRRSFEQRLRGFLRFSSRTSPSFRKARNHFRLETALKSKSLISTGVNPRVYTVQNMRRLIERKRNLISLTILRNQ